MTRILAFSPYNRLKRQTLCEATITRACMVRGAEVKHVLCDGIFSECDMHMGVFHGGARPWDLCRACRAEAGTVFQELGLSYEEIGRYVSDDERRHAFLWAQSLAPEGFPTASYLGFPIWQWILSSLTSYFRRYPPDLEDWKTVQVSRGFLHSGALAIVAINRLLDTFQPDAMIVLNGRQSLTRVAFELARRRGLRVLTHEQPFARGHLDVKDNATCVSLQPFARLWSAWKDVPLNRLQLEQALRWLVDRRYGRNLPWYAFTTPPIDQGNIRSILGLERGRPLWVLFTSSTDEMAAEEDFRGVFETQNEWTEQVLGWVRSHPQVDLVLRLHPHLSSTGKATHELAYYQELGTRLPSNARMVRSEDPLSSYSLMDEGDVGLSFSSLTGIEMAMLGKPIVLGGRIFYENGRRILRVPSRSELPRILESALGRHDAHEIRREAFRLAYRFVFQSYPSFPLVTILGPKEARLNYDSLNDLLPGHHLGLDQICDFLLHGKPLHPKPSAEDLAWTTEEEDAFLAELDRSPSAFRDPAYERHVRRQRAFAHMRRGVKRIMGALPFGIGEGLIAAVQQRAAVP